MNISRRDWFGLAAGVCAAATAASAATGKIKVPGLHIGVTDWNLGLTTKVEALAFAKKIGFEGVEVSFGRPKEGAGKLPIDDAALLERYQAEFKRTKLKLSSMCLDVLHANNLKDNPLGPKWLGMAIPIAKKLKAPSMLLPMFGKNQPQNTAEMDALADKLKDFAAEARKANVVLALENTLSAENNARIIERVGSPALLAGEEAHRHDPPQGPRMARRGQSRSSGHLPGPRRHRIQGICRPRDLKSHEERRGRYGPEPEVRAFAAGVRAWARYCPTASACTSAAVRARL